MPTYWIARAKIISSGFYKKYAKVVPEIINRFGDRVLPEEEILMNIKRPRKTGDMERGMWLWCLVRSESAVLVAVGMIGKLYPLYWNSNG